MRSPRHQRLKLMFSFVLGVVVTAMLFSAAWIEAGRCAGHPCSSHELRLRRVLSLFGAGRTTGTTVATQVAAGRTRAPTSGVPPQLTRPSTSTEARTANVQVATASTRASQLTGQSTKARTAGVYSQEEFTTRQFRTAHTPSNPASVPSATTFSIPKLKYGQRTIPVPSEATHHASLMTERAGNLSCPETSYCREVLSPAEETQFSECTERCRGKSSKFGPVAEGGCRFMEGRGRLPVALASFPGSGNTWTRGLLEKVTGVCTGGLYCDCGLRTGGFTGEMVQGPSVLVMKTHNLKVQFVGGHVFSNTRVPFGAAVLLVRDPRAALVAEWNRERSKRMVSQNISNHYTFVGESFFGENKDWENYIHLKLPRWPQQTVNLLLEAKTAGRPVYVLVFEDLKAGTAQEMKKLTDFLGFSFSEQEVSDRLAAGFSKFYRNHTAEFSHFTPAQEQYVHDVVSKTSQFMKDNGIYDLFPGIDDYR